MLWGMPPLATVTAALEDLAPLRLAAEWDAVGLLVGSRRTNIEKVLSCLSLTAEVAREAIREQIDLIVSHHPLPFRPVARITDTDPTGSVLLDLLHAGIAVWSSHTAWDSAAGGINDQLAELCELGAVTPLVCDAICTKLGFGRMGIAPGTLTVGQLARKLTHGLATRGVQVVGGEEVPVGRMGIVCGSGADGISIARKAGCNTFLTGEIRLHDAIHARAMGMGVIVLGHHASERFSMPVLAKRLATAVPGLDCRASADEADPLVFLGRL